MITLNSARMMPTENSLMAAHKILAQFNHGRLSPQIPNENWREDINKETQFHLFEGFILEEERQLVKARAATAPREAEDFVQWFEELRNSGPGQNDSLFEWLAEDATREEMTWFIQQEVAGEAGFDDLAALTQIKMPTQAKLEIARNYWDEMGRGQERGMHGPMLARVAEELGVESSPLDEIVTESLALANVLVGLAINSRYRYHSVGALGAVELTAPDRSQKVHQGLKRLGLSGEGQRYYLLHSTLDEKHSLTWNKEVLEPLVRDNPEIARCLAEGALMRLNAGARCFERYRKELWGLRRTTH